MITAITTLPELERLLASVERANTLKALYTDEEGGCDEEFNNQVNALENLIKDIKEERIKDFLMGKLNKVWEVKK